MLVKKFWCFLFFIKVLVFADTAAFSESFLDYENEAGETCKAKIQTCSLKLNPENLGVLKIKGDKGDQGPHGIPSFNKGQKGAKGETGEDGLPGTCPTEDDYDPNPGDDTRGNETNPFKYLCETVDKSGIYWVRPASPMTVFCNTSTSSTCVIIKQKQNGKEKDYSAQRKAFWLSEIYDLKEIYQMPIRDIDWLRQKSMHVSLKIRYHCFNSQVLNKTEPENSLRLLTWTDRSIGPKPMGDLPLYYSIENDYCNNLRDNGTQNDWASTDIVVKGCSTRLPIVDMLITSFQANVTQKIRLELVELCFS